ncbi:hypothetical protein FG05_13775 [Fusarium graminearum]|nr:hypothetical protein FG05_13775 [Fusarium graminearum]
MEDPGFIHIADNDDNEFTGITTPRSIYDKFFMSGSGSWSGSGRIRDRCSGGKLLTFGGGPWPPVNVMESRKTRHNYRVGMSTLSTAPISQDSTQRQADRAGSTHSDEAYHVYIQKFYDHTVPSR